MKRRWVTGVVALVVWGIVGWTADGLAQTRLVVKSARAGTSYYALAIGTSNALMTVPGVEVSVEESLGSVANVKEARSRSSYLFTSTSDLIAQTTKRTKPFDEGGYERIRTLWAFPGVVMHWVVRQDSGIKTIRDLEGKRFIPGGIGTATERLTKLVLKVYGLDGKVDLPAVDLKEGVDAVANRRAVGFTTGSPFPTPMVMELVATTPIRLLEIGDAEYKKLAEIDPTYSPTVIPTDTYKGVTGDTKTVASPVLMYTTDDMSDDLAYKLTKAFWDHRKMIGDAHATGKGLDIAGVRYGVAKVHPGAQRYYKAVGVEIPASMR
jgi:TRAP transporter TAXI family solute receptor